MYNFSVHLLFYRINGLNSHILIILISRIICEICEPTTIFDVTPSRVFHVYFTCTAIIYLRNAHVTALGK